MGVHFPHSAGLDVHKKSVVAAVVTGHDEGSAEEVFETKTFGTMTRDLLELADWLHEHGISHVAMESTGEYWKPIYNILEDQFKIFLVNAYHVKHVPGRKTDIADAAWLAKLMTLGLLSASFVPPQGQRELREMTRARAAMVRERTSLVNRLQKTLESANIKLASVATDIQGASARAMLSALLEGEQTAAEMANLAQRRMRSKIPELEKALEGHVKPHHKFILGELLAQIDGLNATIDRFDAEIERMCAGGGDSAGSIPFERAVAHLDTISGIGRTAAEAIVAEIGVDMDRFPTAGHLCAWAGVAPGNHKSAGKTLSRRVRQGNHALKRMLIECANAAKHCRDSYLAAQYYRLAGRRGKQRATMAVAHSILVIAYHLIKRDEDYKDLGGDYFFDARKTEQVAHKLVKRLLQLGYTVQLNPDDRTPEPVPV